MLIFIYIFLFANYVEYVFMCLFPICISSLVNYLFMSFPYFLIGRLIFLLFHYQIDIWHIALCKIKSYYVLINTYNMMATVASASTSVT